MSVTRKKPFSVHNLAIYQKMNKECKVKTVTAQDLALKGYSINEAARCVGVSTTHLSKVLKGERRGSTALLERLSNLSSERKPRPCLVKY